MSNKILIITGNEINHNFFINFLQDKLPNYEFDVLKFHSAKDNFEYYYNVYSKNITNKDERSFLIDFIFKRNITFAQKEKYDLLINKVPLENIFSNQSNFNNKLNKLINNTEYRAVFCYGSPIIKNSKLLESGNTFNIHMGLSKYYKGGTANILALNNNDYDKVGLTCHQLREELDGGDILFEVSNIEYNLLDSLDSLTHYLINKAIDEIIKKIKSDDWSVKTTLQGKLLLNKNILVSDIMSANRNIKKYINE